MLRKTGLRVAIVEHFNSWVKIRQDLWGFADLIAFDPIGAEVWLVQVTTTAHMAERIDKISKNAMAMDWLASHNRCIYVHGWAKRGERGKRKLWTLKTTKLTIDGLKTLTGVM